MKTNEDKTGSDNYRDVARKAVEESLVLIKNENDLLPLKKGTKISIIGPAKDDKVAQCGGWTMDWNESQIKDIPGVISIEEGFIEKADEFGLTILDEKDSDKADVLSSWFTR